MSAVLLAFRNPLAVVRRVSDKFTLEFVTSADNPDELLVIDSALGEALGYADPLAAIEALYAAHSDEFVGDTGLLSLFKAEPSGRSVVRVFNLEGAMRVCRLALTPLAGKVFGNLKGTEMGRAVQAFPRPAQPTAQVVYLFPKRRKARKATRGVRHE
ncbi:hypothetical protein GHO45_26450 [Pseudomonas sp. FSL R10-0765]|uniref:hypothetical protein n=1 Tax=Pseudomonas sp. FSL R10-0765 TaxID=2662195 RepID=UPI0012967D4F|nr:hypothetical protein [Pseudomonas sp. FSL R10-0765]MQT44452.1 hypothetical protein [Pseudomonas sp. FSL R10-0765]